MTKCLRSLQDRDEPSLRDSSTHSALFDLELSQRGVQVAEREGVLARLQAAQEEAELPKDGSVHGLLQRVIYLGRPLMEFELDVSDRVQGACADGGVGASGQARKASARAYRRGLHYRGVCPTRPGVERAPIAAFWRARRELGVPGRTNK